MDLTLDWVRFKLPFPVYQQDPEEKCIDFLTRIRLSLESPQMMNKEDSVFWFLIGVREDIIPKIPFDPEKSLWIEPDELEEHLREIDAGRPLKGPFRTSRFQNCFNYFVCFKCGHWGHKSLQCRNEKPANLIGRALKRKIMELCYTDETRPKNAKINQDHNHSSQSKSEDNDYSDYSDSHQNYYHPELQQQQQRHNQKQPPHRNFNSQNNSSIRNSHPQNNKSSSFQSNKHNNTYSQGGGGGPSQFNKNSQNSIPRRRYPNNNNNNNNPSNSQHPTNNFQPPNSYPNSQQQQNAFKPQFQSSLNS